MLRFLSSQFVRYRQSRTERRLRADNTNLQTELNDSKQRVVDLETDLEKQKVAMRIQQLEVDCLMMVIARNQSRVEAEIVATGELDVPAES